MADTSKKVSELETASQVNNNDLVMLSQGSSQSGFASLKATILAIAQKIVTGINFTSALDTENKTITGAINEVAQGGGGGASELDDLDDVSISSPTNGQVLKYNSTSQEWENANAGGGSGGHNIIDSDGNEMTARSGLQFENAYVSDDSADDKTVVPIYREMTRQEYSQAQDKTGLIVVTDDKAKVVNADSVYPVETSISEHAYSIGDHLIVDGITYIVIDDIAIGDSLVEDTNIEAETIDDRLVSAIADNLTTDDSTKALSAKQGKVLNEKIDASKLIYQIQSATFSNGQATVTHNFGKANKIIPLPYASLVPITVINMDANSFTLKVAFISDSNVADSKVATNYSGTFDVQYFIVPT